MKHVERSRREPSGHTLGTEKSMAVLCEHDSGRKQDEPIDALCKASGGVNRDDGAEARPNQRNRARLQLIDPPRNLIEHPRHRQRSEVGLIEVGTMKRKPVAAKAFGEERRLLRPRRRGKSVEIEDVADRRHRSVWHPRRQRQAMRPSPSVL